MRLFVAIDFNELKDYFIELQKHLPSDKKLSLVKSFHLTLKFLGDVQSKNFDEIVDNLKKIKVEPFNVNLDLIGLFYAGNEVRVVWVGLNPEEKIIELQKQVDASLKNLFKKEKDFKAHITLARTKFPDDKKYLVDDIKKIKVDSKRIEIKDFRLIKSTLTSQDQVYEDLETFNFH
ncbi:MAG TPA: RNA 2',3'-cyclic phosphodiesterase [Candidatus Nanoarchaeia archaeon]|nr:RNA 2',3'-cyclic phosphodiesterase [Candidatus Nanoarchaeia archaeon]